MKNLTLPLLILFALTVASCNKNENSLTFNAVMLKDNSVNNTTTNVEISDNTISLKNKKGLVSFEKQIVSSIIKKDNNGDDYTIFTLNDGSKYYDLNSKMVGRRGLLLTNNGEKFEFFNYDPNVKQFELNFN